MTTTPPLLVMAQARVAPGAPLRGISLMPNRAPNHTGSRLALMFEAAVQHVIVAGDASRSSLGTVQSVETRCNIELAYTTHGLMYRMKGDDHWRKITPPGETSAEYDFWCESD